MEGLDLYNGIIETKAVEVKHQLVTANDWYEELFRTKTAKKNYQSLPISHCSSSHPL